MSRILITGVAGSGGSYLAEYLADTVPNVELHGLSRWHSTTHQANLKSLEGRIHLHECDLTDMSSVLSAVKASKPDYIFHLASHANVRAGFITPLSVLHNNIMGTANLFEAVRLLELDPIIQHCSTSEVYGQVDPENVPINENCPIRPSSPYAVSKTAQDHLAYSYFVSYGLKIIRTRMFAYINPRRGDLFATSFAMQVARIEKGLQSILYHGNLESVRTLIDVRDAMEAYWIAALRCQPGEVYNIGGETSITVGAFLNLLKKHAKVTVQSAVDPKLIRPSDVTLQIPDCSKFFKQTNWKPKYSFEDSVQLLLESCRNAV